MFKAQKLCREVILRKLAIINQIFLHVSFVTFPNAFIDNTMNIYVYLQTLCLHLPTAIAIKSIQP
jgi:hypothetical protein